MIEEEITVSRTPNKLLKILLLLFVLFLIMYISKESGLYEFKTYTKTRLTNEAILKFEKDVEDGKDVNIEDYLSNKNHDYSNFFNKSGTEVGNLIEKIMNNGIKKTLKVLNKLFYEK